MRTSQVDYADSNGPPHGVIGDPGRDHDRLMAEQRRFLSESADDVRDRSVVQRMDEEHDLHEQRSDCSGPPLSDN